MSRYTEDGWEADVKAQIQRLAMVFTSLRTGAMEVYLDVLEFCSAVGVKESVESWLRTEDPQAKTPTPGQVMARVPKDQIDAQGLGIVTNLNGWDIAGNLSGPWADKEPPICEEKEAKRIAKYLGEFWDFQFTSKHLEFFRKLGVATPQRPVEQAVLEKWA